MVNVKNGKFSDFHTMWIQCHVHVCLLQYNIIFVHFELQWVLLATIRDSDHERVSSILQESCADLDDNSQDYVCILL